MDWRLYTNATTAAVYEAALARYFGAAAGQARDEIMSLRHGPVPPARRMFEISAEETMGFVRSSLVHEIVDRAVLSLKEAGVRESLPF